ncbi:MAG: hypothetical protein ACP5N6_03000 [Anaerolineae bacterium]
MLTRLSIILKMLVLVLLIALTAGIVARPGWAQTTGYWQHVGNWHLGKPGDEPEATLEVAQTKMAVNSKWLRFNVLLHLFPVQPGCVHEST